MAMNSMSISIQGIEPMRGPCCLQAKVEFGTGASHSVCCGQLHNTSQLEYPKPFRNSRTISNTTQIAKLQDAVFVYCAVHSPVYPGLQ